ncbi:MAG: lysine--tRNA ligase [Nanoarchaeota archaeon]
MDDEHRLVKERLRKIEELRQAGINPYPSLFKKKDSAAGIKERHAKLKKEEQTKDKVAVAGRLMSFRDMGKAAFAHILDATGRIQLFFRQDDLGEQEYKILKKLDVGDFLGAEGEVFCTKTGEITVYVKKFKLLTKSLLPLPEKFHGLQDQELRYRMRYLDLVMNPEVKEIFIKRSKTIAAIREFLTKEGYIEVETPILQPIYGGTSARPFKSKLNALNMDVYMRISNEMYLKRLIVGGYEKIFEFSQDFRNEGIDRTHNPEFLQMETMCAYADYMQNMDTFERMIEFVAKNVLGTTAFEYQGTKIDVKAPWKRMTMFDAIKKHSGHDLKDEADLHTLKKIAREAGAEVKEGMIWGELIAAIFETTVEKHLIQPTIIYDFPADTSPLSKKKESDPRFVERFEPYINGWELGNAYSELNDPQVLKDNWKQQKEKMKQGDEEAQPLDEDFIRALEYGMPPTSGIGIGVDRVVMLLTNSQSIRDVIFFPFMRAEN